MLKLRKILGLNCWWVVGFGQGFGVVITGFRIVIARSRCDNGGEVRSIFDDWRVLRDG